MADLIDQNPIDQNPIDPAVTGWRSGGPEDAPTVAEGGSAAAGVPAGLPPLPPLPPLVAPLPVPPVDVSGPAGAAGPAGSAGSAGSVGSVGSVGSDGAAMPAVDPWSESVDESAGDDHVTVGADPGRPVVAEMARPPGRHEEPDSWSRRIAIPALVVGCLLVIVPVAVYANGKAGNQSSAPARSVPAGNGTDLGSSRATAEATASSPQQGPPAAGAAPSRSVSPSPKPSPSATRPLPPTEAQISPTAWYGMVNKHNGLCVDVRSASSANGAPVQQFTCNGTPAQRWQFQPTSDGYVRITSRLNSAQILDLKDAWPDNGAVLHLWEFFGGNNQNWRPVSEGNGYYHFANRFSSKCLDVPSSSTDSSVQLVQFTCNGAATQSFRVVEG